MYNDDALQKQQQEMEEASAEEKELWVSPSVLRPHVSSPNSWFCRANIADAFRLQTDLLRLSRTNFSEAYQLLVHLKVVRLYVESVLRYGLPAEYSAIVLQVGRARPSSVSLMTDLIFADWPARSQDLAQDPQIPLILLSIPRIKGTNPSQGVFIEREQ